MTITACIGTGLVGAAWAALFARAGHQVRLYDADPAQMHDRALPLIRQAVADLGGALEPSEPIEAVMARITVSPSIADAVAGATHVQESVREDLAVKQGVVAEIAAASADAVIASSTSALRGSQFLADIANPERALIAHPVNPPSHIRLVELCSTGRTAEDVIARTRDFMSGLGMAPVVLNREIDGFLLNRLQYTLVAEAMHLVAEGYASPQDIDRVVTEGLAPRWAFIGPFMTAHLNARDGFQGFVDQLEPMMRHMGRDARTDYPWTADHAARIHDAMSAQTPVTDIPKAQSRRNANILRLRALRDAGEQED